MYACFFRTFLFIFTQVTKTLFWFPLKQDDLHGPPVTWNSNNKLKLQIINQKKKILDTDSILRE